MELHPLHDEFIDELEGLMMKYLSFKDKKVCRQMACSVLLCGVKGIFYNSPSSKDFAEDCERLFSELVKEFLKEQIPF